MSPERSDPRRPPLPPRIAYYLRHLLRGRFRLVPAPAIQPPPIKGRLLDFTRRALSVIPESPAFHAQLAALSPTRQSLQGWLWLAEAHRPLLILDSLGAWTLRLPTWGRRFQSLHELRTPQDLAPRRTEAKTIAGGVTQRCHQIPLRSHRGAFLMLAVTHYPSGGIAYETWVWHAAQRQAIPLLWDEAERVIGLFRDLTASWFWVQAETRQDEKNPAAEGTGQGAPTDAVSAPAAQGGNKNSSASVKQT